MKLSRSAKLLLAAAMLWFPGAGEAQTPPVDPRTDAEVHMGPFYMTPRVTLEEFGVDTNVFNSADEKRDFTFTLAPHVDVWVPFTGRALFTTSVTTDVVYYHTYASERSVNPDVRFRADLLLNRVSLFAEPSYLRSRERLNYEIDARARRSEDGLGLGSRLRLTSKLSVELAARQSDVRFDADAIFDGTPLQETLNRRERTGSIALRDSLTPYTTVQLRAEAQALRFDLSPLRDADSFAVLPGILFNPLALISGSASVGYRRFRPLRDAIPRFDGVVVNKVLGYRLRGVTQLRFTAQRDVAYSYSPTDPYYVFDGYGITARHHLSGRFDVTGAAERYHNAYRNLGSGDLPETGRADFTRSASMSVGYRFGETARLGFGVIYRQRRSNIDRFKNYDGFRFLSSIDYGI